MIEKLKVKLAVYLVVRDKEQILLLKRQNTGYMDGYYSLIAGHVDPSEDALRAMAREAKEEASISIKERDLKLLLTCHRTSCNYIDLYFTTKTYSGTITNQEPDKCSDLSFFSVNNLPENIIPEVKKSIESILEGKNYITF